MFAEEDSRFSRVSAITHLALHRAAPGLLWNFAISFKPGKYGFRKPGRASRCSCHGRVGITQTREKSIRNYLDFDVQDAFERCEGLPSTRRFRLNRFGIISKTLAILTARFGLDSTLGRGTTGRRGARSLISSQNGTFEERSYNSYSYGECSIAVACYLCNTFLKTAGVGPFRVVLLLRVQKCSGMLIVRRRGASRGRPVKWFA